MEFTLGGKRYDLARQQVEERMRGVEPEPGRRHFVEVRGREYPMKQVFAECLGLSRLDFTTAQARHVLARLGFKVIER